MLIVHHCNCEKRLQSLHIVKPPRRRPPFGSPYSLTPAPDHQHKRCPVCHRGNATVTTGRSGAAG
eukprot:12808431-Prorocentrum_lima.AAC.1